MKNELKRDAPEIIVDNLTLKDEMKNQYRLGISRTVSTDPL